MTKIADGLLCPLKSCGNAWNTLPTQQLEPRALIEKVSIAARKVILAFATALAFIPGLIGSLIKSFSGKTAAIHISGVEIDSKLHNFFEKIKIYESNPCHCEIGNDIIKAHPDMKGSVSVINVTEDKKQNKISITFDSNTVSSGFVKYLKACFIPNKEERIKKLVEDMFQPVKADKNSSENTLSLRGLTDGLIKDIKEKQLIERIALRIPTDRSASKMDIVVTPNY